MYIEFTQSNSCFRVVTHDHSLDRSLVARLCSKTSWHSNSTCFLYYWQLIHATRKTYEGNTSPRFSISWGSCTSFLHTLMRMPRALPGNSRHSSYISPDVLKWVWKLYGHFQRGTNSHTTMYPNDEFQSISMYAVERTKRNQLHHISSNNLLFVSSIMNVRLHSTT